jgi:carbon monoxide dehydrogenase subunit G
MILKDSFEIEAPIEAVWAFLLDIPRVSTCVPGAEAVAEVEADRYRGKLKARVGAVKAAFAGEAKIEEKVPPKKLAASFKAQDRALASIVTGSFVARLTSIENGTQLDYEMEIAMRGRLGTIGFTVVQQTAKKMSAAFIECVAGALARLDPGS